VVLAAPFISIVEFFVEKPETPKKKDEVLAVSASIATPASLPTTPKGSLLDLNNTAHTEHDDGIQDAPTIDFYDKKPFVAATVLLPIFIATLVITTGEDYVVWKVVVFNIVLAPFYFATFTVCSFYMEALSHKFRKARFVFKLVPFLAFAPFIVEAFPRVTNVVYGVSMLLVVPMFVVYVLFCFIYFTYFHLKKRYSKKQTKYQSPAESKESQNSSVGGVNNSTHEESNISADKTENSAVEALV
jgi:hypothetical protein